MVYITTEPSQERDGRVPYAGREKFASSLNELVRRTKRVSANEAVLESRAKQPIASLVLVRIFIRVSKND
jgi:hypothetical protein